MENNRILRDLPEDGLNHNEIIQVDNYEILEPETKIPENLFDLAKALMILKEPTSDKLGRVLSSFQVPENTLETVREKLSDSESKDEKEYKEKYKNEMKNYNNKFKENGFWKRRLLKISRNYSKNKPLEKKVVSENTKLLKKRIEIGELINGSSNIIKGIPELLDNDQKKYSELEKIIENNKKLILQTEQNLEVFPKKIQEYKLFITQIDSYTSLPKTGKTKLIKKIKKSDYKDEFDLNNKDERDKILLSAKKDLGKLENGSASTNSKVETLKYGIVSSHEQIIIMDQGFEQVMESFLPSINQLYKLKTKSDKLQTFQEHYEIIDGMNDLLLKAPEKINEVEEVIREARKVLEDKSLDAIVYSKSYEELGVKMARWEKEASEKLSNEISLERF